MLTQMKSSFSILAMRSVLLGEESIDSACSNTSGLVF